MLKQFVLALTLLVGCSMYGNAQVSPTVSVNGFSLQKSVSLSTPKSGDIFSYTVTFSIPAGAVDVFVFDQIPSPLVIDGVITPPSYSGFVPTVTNTAGLVKLYFPSVTSSISGSFQVNVHFPVDSACNGKRVANFAELTAKLPPNTKLKTEPVYSTCVVDNPWRIQKYPNGLAYIGPPCPYATISDTVDYTVRIVKQNWVLSGSASWYNVSLNDILYGGAVVIPGTYTSSANMSPSSIGVGGAISLPPGFKLDANANNVYWARFKVKHAPIPNNSCDSNSAKFSAVDACNNPFTETSTVKVKKVPPAPVGQLSKWASVTGNLPGCTGTYFIRVCNTGTAPLPAYTLADNFPACLVAGSVIPNAPPSGCTISGSGYNYTMAGPSLLPGQCHTYSFNFTIGTGCGTNISNTVTATSGFTGSATANIALLPPVATACLTKTICSPAPNAYAVGTQVRFRLRVQNIGGTPITLADIKDQLDNSSLEYVGNELYYSYPNPFAPCAPNPTTIPSGATVWPGVGTFHNPTTGALQWNLPSIGVECGNVPYPACGFAYGLKAYYIEFTVKIKDTAGIGNIRNCAVIGNGTLSPTTVSSCATFVTNGVLNYTVSKQVSKDNGATYSSGVSVSPGAVVDYKLAGVNSGIGLINPVLVDLLPRDNGTSDNFILNCSPRGSNFDVRYNSFVSSSHTYSGQFFSNAVGANTVPELGIALSCMPTVPTWVTSPWAGTANLKTQLSQPFGSSPALAYVFKAQTDPSGKEGDVACNTYALRGSAKYIFNYVPTYLLQPALESGKACVTLEKAGCCDPYGFDIPKEVCVNYNNLYCVKDSCNPANQYTWDFGDGSPVVVGTCINYAYTNPGTYTITIKWRNECGEYSREFSVNVKDCPCDVKVSYTINTNGLTILADGTATTSSLPAVMYVWSFGDGTFGTGPIASHTYANPGNYSVTLTVYALDAHGNICECKADCKTEIYVDKDKVDRFSCNPQRTPVKKDDVLLKASPNPFRNNINVSFEIVNKMKTTNETGYTLELMNLNGNTLQRIKLQNLQSVVSIDSKTYPAGVYFVVLKNAKGDVQSTRVVKL